MALVGLGMAVSPHTKNALDLADRVEVAYAYSPSAERRAQFAEKFPFPQCYKLEAILEDPSVDAVAVLTPPNTHLEIVKRCAVAGKHVLLEKPLEITTARAEKMIAECRAGRVTLGVVLQHRHKPASVWQDFLDAIQHGGEPRVNGEEALRVHRLIDALLEAAAKGAAVHFSPAGMGTR